MTARKGTEKALSMLRSLPRVSFGNIMGNPGDKRRTTRNRGRHGGKTHGCGQKGGHQRQCHMPAGFETGNTPFHMRFPVQNYYKREHFDLECTPLSLQRLQLLMDTNRLSSDTPIDITMLARTGIFRYDLSSQSGGFMLTDENVDMFGTCINLEVQYATETTIAAVEKHGGIISTSYFDPLSLHAACDPFSLFKRSAPIPKRQLPPPRLLDYYSDPKNRGYLADPKQVAEERHKLAQKYGYTVDAAPSLPEHLQVRKDPRQIFFGLEPGWIVNLEEGRIYKPLDKELLQFYNS